MIYTHQGRISISSTLSINLPNTIFIPGSIVPWFMQVKTRYATETALDYWKDIRTQHQPAGITFVYLINNHNKLIYAYYSNILISNSNRMFTISYSNIG